MWNCGVRVAVAQLVEPGKAHPVSAVQVRPAVLGRWYMSGYGHGKKSVFILVQPTAGGFNPRCRPLIVCPAFVRAVFPFHASGVRQRSGNINHRCA